MKPTASGRIQTISIFMIPLAVFGALIAAVLSLRSEQSQPAAKPAAPASAAPALAPDSVEASAWKLLTEMAASDKASRRTDALAALSSIGPRPEVVKLVERSLDDKESGVRTVAISALSEMKSRSSIPRLKGLLDDEKPEVSFAAAKALWEMGDRSGRNVFVDVLAGDRATGPGVVRSGLNTAKKELNSPMGLTMIGVEQGAGAFLGPFSMGISVVEAFAKDSSAPARALAASLLAQDTNADTRKQLEDGLDDKNWVVRASAARALGGSGYREEIKKLQSLVDDDKQKEAVRCMAAASIVRLSRSSASTTRPQKRAEELRHLPSPAGDCYHCDCAAEIRFTRVVTDHAPEGVQCQP